MLWLNDLYLKSVFIILLLMKLSCCCAETCQSYNRQQQKPQRNPAFPIASSKVCGLTPMKADWCRTAHSSQLWWRGVKTKTEHLLINEGFLESK